MRESIYLVNKKPSGVPIVSLSLPDQMVKAMDEIQESVGFAGRSELMRAAIRLLLEDTKDKNALSGKTNAVVVVGHASEDEEPVTRLKHSYGDVVKTHIHCRVSQEDCIEVFVLAGEGKQISEMAKGFERERKIKMVKLLRV
ncbi:MAG TPA: CopG family ribbon-helix-helix protein [Nitrososphaerales archaeon]|nr:CopG family ribbon-helix-helix protein [Nitrososphaerales archaeon]